jgi:hypothetical protein
MRRNLYVLWAIVTMLVVPTLAWAAGQGTPDEAKAMAIKAAEYLKSVGPEKAFPEFNAKDGPWHDRDLYVYVLDSKGMMTAHGTNPGLRDKMVLDLPDVDGKLFFRDILAIKDAGWVTYKWQNPLTKKVEPKNVYAVRVGEFLVDVGAYAQ